MKLLTKSLLVLGCAVTVASVAGVSASWKYAEGDYKNVEQDLSVEIENFVWAGSEVLPDDVQGEDHHSLIAAIVHGQNGLNTPNSALNQQITARKDSWRSWDTFGSMDWRDEAEMNDLFNLETDGLSFMLYFPDDQPNKQYLFTTSVDLGEPGWFSAAPNIPIGEYVYVVYRTELTWDDTLGEWVEEQTEVGYAKSAYYNNDLLGSVARKCPAFDATSWTAGKLGTTRATSIYAYVGETTTAYVDSATEVAYYDLTNGTAGTRSVTSTNLDCSITIMDKNGKTLATSQIVTAGDGSKSVSVSWSASANTLYYIAVSGDTSMTFTIA